MKKKILTFSQSINEAIMQAMASDKSVFSFGIAVDKTGHVFKSTNGILKKFGKKRIFDTPNSEQALTAFALGASLNGKLRPILIHHRVDFMPYSFDQLINWISLWSFKSANKSFAPLVIRTIVGRGWGQGPQHAKTLHTMFSYLPGLRVVMPSSASEAKGMLLSSIFSNDPVIFIEYRSLYNTKELVPEKKYFIDLDSPRLRLKGNSLTLVAAGASVLTSLKAAEIIFKEKGLKLDLFDLRSISNMNLNPIFISLKKTKRLVVVEDGWENFGYSAEILAKVFEKGIDLKSPPIRICWPNSHVPMSAPLEKKFYFDENDIVNACNKVLNS
jgi:pyruvate/2-oxoglutarate/acetoin dehydrogenase E1 component